MSSETGYRDIDRKARVRTKAVKYARRPVEERIQDFEEEVGLIFTDEEVGATSREGVFAAGDNVHGPDLVITAIATAHKAAESIDAYLNGLQVSWAEPPPPREKK
jgi:NADPH-dependent glutamate synthase beta subunit-like oxidoreductase